MEIEEYYTHKKELYDIILKYIEDGNDFNDPYYQNLRKNIENQKFPENREELKEIIRMVIIISKNHHRYPGFFSKFEKILLSLKEKIKQSFSNTEIFDFCKNNKLIILFLMQNNIITIDKSIIDLIVKNTEIDKFYCHFFYPEINDNQIKQRIEDEIINTDPNILENFEQKRQIGENDSQICTLIRNDSVDKFIEYIKQTNLSLTSKIKPSIFETNPFLIKKEPTLIEYAVFYRSIGIFQFLRTNNVELTPSLWLYAIHGRMIELIHQLIDNKIEPEDKTYEIYLEESIKCHHNDMANYFIDNFIDKNDECSEEFGFHYLNYYYMPKNINNQRSFCLLCKYDYFSFVELLLKIEKSMINATAISKKLFI